MDRAIRLSFWIIFGLAMAVYVTMLTWSLPKLSDLAGGLAPFDMRPAGYTFDEAQALLRALSPGGIAFYRDVQLRLDLLYPALIGVSVVLGIVLLTPQALRRYRWLLASFALPIAPFDYLENAAIARMLQVGDMGLTPQLVAAASRWTVLKSSVSTVAMSLLLVLLVLRVVRRVRGARPSPGG